MIASGATALDDTGIVIVTVTRAAVIAGAARNSV